MTRSTASIRTFAGVASLHVDEGGRRVHFHAGRRRWLGLVWTLLAVSSGVIGGWLLVGSGVPGLSGWESDLLGYHFLVVGAIGLALALYQLGNSLDVVVGAGRVRVVRRWFGVPLSDRAFGARRLQRLRIDGQPGAVGRSALLTEFGITARLANGDEVVLADSFPERGAAERLARLFGTWLGFSPGALRRLLMR